MKKTHSQTLLPMIDEICKMTETEPESFDLIAVSQGPGSFTGLRIGSATAKGFGLALNKPIINVPTIDAMAYNFYSSNYIICPIMDARRQQVYTGIYYFEQTHMKILKEQCAISVEDLIDELDKRGKTVMFLGDGVPAYREIIDEKMKKRPCIFIGMVCVPEEFQGQGYMRSVMELAYAEGNRLKVPVILETDAKSKCDKYIHLGMHLEGIRDLGNYGKIIRFDQISRLKWIKIPSLTLYRAKNSHNPSIYQGYGCFLFRIDIVLFLKLCYFFCIVSLISARISAFDINS